MSAKPPLNIKADRFLLPVLIPHSANLVDVLTSLREKITLAGEFLRQARLVVDVSDWLDADVRNFTQLLEALQNEGLRVLGLRGATGELAIFARNHGLAVFQQEALREPAPEPAPQAASTEAESASMVVEQPVRSGQQIYARDKNIVLLHGVNAGAEVIADGHIHVYGKLAGRALAGAAGNTTARIYTTQFEAQLVAIAGRFMHQDHPLMSKFMGNSVTIRLQHDELIFEPLG